MLLLVSAVILIILLTHATFKIYLRLTCGRCTSPTCLLGKTVLITGGNAGIGYQTALALAGRGCRLIIADKDDCKATKQTIINETGNSNIVTKYLDLSSLSSVRALATDIIISEPRLDILINNAGNGNPKSDFTEDGFYRAMQVNHLGPFLLTNLLLGLMRKTAPSRVIFLVSSIVKFTKMHPNEMNLPKATPLNGYACAKLCTMATIPGFVKLLGRSGVTVNCLHPGVVNTTPKGVSKLHDPKLPSNYLVKLVYSLYSKTAEEGAQTSLYLALSRDVEHTTGKYFENCKIYKTPGHVMHPDFTQQIWDMSREFVKLDSVDKSGN